MVATVISVLGALTVPLVLPFSHRFGRQALFRGMAFTAFVTTILVAVYSNKPVFDHMHQKRLFVLHLENVRLFFYVPCISLIAFRSPRTSITSTLRPLTVPLVSKTSFRILCKNSVFLNSLLFLSSWTTTTAIGILCIRSLQYVLRVWI